MESGPPDMVDSAEELYGLPLDEFTAARNELAAELKKNGDAEGAASVKALKKPPVTVWAINQLARSDPDEVSALLDAGERLRGAQDAVLEGSDPGDLRAAMAERRELVTELARRAAKSLDKEGAKASRTHIDRISSTLLNAAVDDEARDSLRSGTLTADVDAADDLGAAWTMAAVPDLEERPAGEVRTARKEAERLAREADDAEALATEMAQEATRARSVADQAMQAASDARRSAQEARRRANEARHNL
ncbi:MAG: hypothetical protein ACRDJL_04800 [Actinomycetota bacterium]